MKETNCFLCKKGVYPFVKKDNEYMHYGLFGEGSGKCTTINIKELLYENKGHGTYLPNPDFLKFLNEQANWWEDLSYIINKVSENTSITTDDLVKNIKISWACLKIENAILEIASNNNLEITEEDFDKAIQF